MREDALLRKCISAILQERYITNVSKKLRVFDFDDTLVRTGSLIHVTDCRGRKFDLTPGEYAVYEPLPGDEFDYSDFSVLIDPKEIIWTCKILRNIIRTGGEVVILTARRHQEPVFQFLQDAGLPPIEVIALASSDPEKKADYIERRIVEDGIQFVEFFDDSPKNVEAVEKLNEKYPGTKVVSRHIVHREEI